jgi:cellulose synthase operon protein C
MHGTRHGCPTELRRLGLVSLALLALLTGTLSLPAQKSEPGADSLLASARQAHKDHDYAAAIARYRDFLARFGDHKDAPAARLDLAVCLLEGPEIEPAAAREQLQRLAGNKDFADYPAVLYYLGVAHRGLGVRELLRADAEPRKAEQHRTAAVRSFEEAGKQFAAAAEAFAARAGKVGPDAKDLPPAFEWAACCRCCQAEMLLRSGKTEPARSAVAPFLDDPLLVRSHYRAAALYYHGFACFLLKDYLAAGRSLNLLAPFDQQDFGSPARYLLGRVHHLADERHEAALQYQAVLDDYEEQKKNAAEALKQPETLKNDPGAKARLQALVDEPPPGFVVRAGFCLGVLEFEDGRFNEARVAFQNCAAQTRLPALAAEARLCAGFCEVRLGQFAEAMHSLRPLADKETPQTAEALLWLGKAQAGSANPEDEENYEPTLKTAVETLRRAADHYRGRPGAMDRLGEVLLELADTEQLARRYHEAAALYGEVLRDDLLPRRGEEVLQRQLTALNLAGDYRASDELCTRFQKSYPKNILLPEVVFRSAENSWFQARAADRQAAAALRDEAARRYRLVIDRYPEFEQVNLARHGLALAHYHKGAFDKTREVLESIQVPDRHGELAVVPYLLAECLIRSAPTKIDDALAAGRLSEQLNAAVEMLGEFVGDQPDSPLVPDALLRLGFCQQRLAAVLSQPEEQNKLRDAARGSYETILLDYPWNELQPQAAHQRAKLLAQANPLDGINRLRRFTAEPLRKSSITPLALLSMATLLRGQEGRAWEAAAILGQYRKQHEKTLLGDPSRASWVPLLQYHHAVTLKESGKPTEARVLFEELMKQYPERPEAAEAKLRWGQCRWDEGWQQIDQANQKLGAADTKPAEAAAAQKALEQGQKITHEAADYFEKQAAQLKDNEAVADLRARLLYEAALCQRAYADEQVGDARGKIQSELQKKLHEEVARRTTEGEPVPDVPPPEVALARVELQPAEKKARTLYRELIDAFPDTPLAVEARLELAEAQADREDFAPAVKLLAEAIDREPPAEMTDRLRLRLGMCQMGRGDLKAALTQFNAVAARADSPWAGQGHYRSAECLMQAGDWKGAVEHLALFRDKEAFQNLGGLSDRALLRLGHALARLQQWDKSREAFEQLIARFDDSPWVNAARYGIGWVWQRQQEYDKAIAAYTPAASDANTETGVRSRVQIGICLFEQKKYAEAAAKFEEAAQPLFADLGALALLAAAAAHDRLKEREQAEKLLQRVLHDVPDSPWATAARQRLKPGNAPPPHELPEAVRLLTPDLDPAPLDPLGQPQSDRASLDDPTEEQSLAAALNRAPPERAAPAPPLRLVVPDPYENHRAVQNKIPADDDHLPLGCTPRRP